MLRKEEEIKVSVVIPVYNAGKFLRECLDSILAQDIREIELLCVDDGSTDDSPEMLAQYAADDNRIHLIRQHNEGAGKARNAGLEQASGEYVLFMDADDTVLPGALMKLWSEAHRSHADVIRCRSLDYDNETGVVTHGSHNYLKKVPFWLFGRPLSYPEAYWLFPKLNAAPWGGLCRRDFLIEQKIRFNSLVCVNDRSFYWESVLKAKRIVLSRTCLIRYRMNLSDSLVSGRIRHFDCHFRSYELIEEMSRGLPDRYRRSILNGELLDLANWLEQAVKTSLGSGILKASEDFIERMDKDPWNEDVEHTKWYKRINACKRED